jgi:hypothetical protein
VPRVRENAFAVFHGLDVSALPLILWYNVVNRLLTSP